VNCFQLLLVLSDIRLHQLFFKIKSLNKWDTCSLGEGTYLGVLSLAKIARPTGYWPALCALRACGQKVTVDQQPVVRKLSDSERLDKSIKL